METFSPVARTEHFDLPHIGKDKITDMKEVVKKSLSDKQKLMVEVFNNLKKGTTFQVIEKNQNNEDDTDVILRQDNGSGGGISGPRFPHGTAVELVSTPGRENINGYSFRTMRDSKGQERIYIHVRANGQEGYMAMEHVGIKDVPVDTEPTPVVPPVQPEEKKQDAEPTTVVPPVQPEEKKQDAEPTTDTEKQPEEKKQDAEPTTDTEKKPEEKKQDAEPTTDTEKKPEEKKQDAEPTPNTEKKPEEKKQDAEPPVPQKTLGEPVIPPTNQEQSNTPENPQEDKPNTNERARYPEFYIVDSDGDWTPDETGLPMLDTKKVDYWKKSILNLIRQVGGPEEMKKLLDMEINDTIGFNRSELRAKTDRGLFFLNDGLGNDKSDFFDKILEEYKQNNHQLPSHLIEPYYAEKK